MLFGIVKFGGYFFMGLWLKETMVVSESSVHPNTYATNNHQATMPQIQQVVGGADKLKAYKELLDLGIVTQEEFDEKKKQILAL